MVDTCKHGKWTYSKLFEVYTFHCYRDTEPIGCYFSNCQEECPNYPHILVKD